MGGGKAGKEVLMETDEKQKAPTPPPPEMWSGITAGDLGLKAVYWTGGTAEDGLTFRPIVGWITFNTIGPASPPYVPHGFAAIVISDAWLPTLASAVAGFQGVAPKDASNEVIKRQVEEWRAAGEVHRARMNAPMVGEA